MHGKGGKYTSAYGDFVFEGTFANDEPAEGTGEIRFRNGDAYAGEIKGYAPDGEGIMTYAGMARRSSLFALDLIFFVVWLLFGSGGVVQQRLRDVFFGMLGSIEVSHA